MGGRPSASNKGFSTRLVTAFAQDTTHPSDLYLGVVNNKEWGGAFVSHDGGLSWSQRERGTGWPGCVQPGGGEQRHGGGGHGERGVLV